MCVWPAGIKYLKTSKTHVAKALLAVKHVETYITLQQKEHEKNLEKNNKIRKSTRKRERKERIEGRKEGREDRKRKGIK